MSPKAAVIGLGNPIRKDDAIGILALRVLQDKHRHPGRDYLDFGTASFDLLHRFQSYEKVLLIDGIKAPGLAPGELVVRHVDEFEYQTNLLPASSHELDLTALFELAKSLGSQTQVFVAGIQVEDVSYGEGLSRALDGRFDEIVEKIAEFIEKNL